ncbi:phosphoadenosine phosphosulfate reductase family protein [Thermosyntropha sp.]|uniref:phosphoadenosine phosphosulfate reductase domain-containing protein n=1 Tax=Thermosyntropha sp. TaxID=2740820 RepID=UPI0025D69742|nr:phosphoadenosine phosphosulfate reductase family protein [Thermosyntropha sp.]MBO8159628.1 phosphoadenosine phosphosulfate reductase family protein [Thermosyntropha sp.]
MWCKNCHTEVYGDVCVFCGGQVEQEVPTEIFWCDRCKVPIVYRANDVKKNYCSLCSAPVRYLAADIRPVFPEERLWLEILLEKPFAYIENSVWCSENRYYIDGKPKIVRRNMFKKFPYEYIAEQLELNQGQNTYYYFELFKERWTEANREHLNSLKEEAVYFINSAAAAYPPTNIVVSFSGGKDSTVVSDLVVKALTNPFLVHIFCDTTLELPQTLEYVQRFKKDNPQVIFKTAKNKEQNFYEVCREIGPPARMLRWCCSMFKTGPINRIFNNLYRDEKVLTFYGIRRSESASRSKYNRIEGDSEYLKIRKQTVASPIFFWKDIDVWLYILAEGLDFNDAYRLGYERVGCWCCPNNNERAQFLSNIYMPEKAKEWRDFLINFAREIGKTDAEEYVDSGNWKARQGGRGLKAARDVKIKFSSCTNEENARIYQLNKPITENFITLFYPFGKVAEELGRRLINEIIILDINSKVPIISIQPLEQNGQRNAVKIKTMNVKDHEDLQRMISYQIRKYNACRECLKCEALCQFGAISVTKNQGYFINEEKCRRCRMCVTAKYLDGGCLMSKYLYLRQE